MDMFRAVARGVSESKVYGWRPDTRLPGNVPYLIDNLWEFARPDHLPSRRRAVFASPTPELAIANATAGNLAQNDYVACKVKLNKTPSRISQLSVSDARFHDDIKALQKLVHAGLSSWERRDIDSKLAFAALFLPGTTASELREMMAKHAELAALVEKAAAAVTLWSDPPNLAEGEIVFELDRDTTYTLELI